MQLEDDLEWKYVVKTNEESDIYKVRAGDYTRAGNWNTIRVYTLDNLNINRLYKFGLIPLKEYYNKILEI